MKKILTLGLLALMMFQCKKSGNNAPEKILLSRMMVNGISQYRFYYDSDKKITRVESFSTTEAEKITQQHILVYHGNDYPDEVTIYDEPGHTAIYKILYSIDDKGMPDTAWIYNLSGPTPNQYDQLSHFSYNADGKILVAEIKDKNGKYLYRYNYAYYEGGRLKQIDMYQPNGALLYLRERSNFSIPGSNYPPGLDEIEKIFNPELLVDLISDSYQTFDYDQSGFVTFNTAHTMSGRVYNDDGTLKSQTITMKKIKPAGSDVVGQRQYEYIRQ